MTDPLPLGAHTLSTWARQALRCLACFYEYKVRFGIANRIPFEFVWCIRLTCFPGAVWEKPPVARCHCMDSNGYDGKVPVIVFVLDRKMARPARARLWGHTPKTTGIGEPSPQI